MSQSQGFNRHSFNSDHFAFAKVVDGRKLHLSKLQFLIGIYWKLQGLVSVVQQSNNSFLLYFQYKEDLSYMLLHGTWMLQGFSITLLTWKASTTSSYPSAHLFPVWVQIHGLPSHYFDVKTARHIGEKLGHFVNYDKSLSNCYGMRIQVCLLQYGLNFPKLNCFQLPDGKTLKLSIVLEQVGRVCSSCMGIGHVAQRCKVSLISQPTIIISAVGYRSVGVKYDVFSGLYSTTARMSGVHISMHDTKSKNLCKRKVDLLELDNKACKKIRVHDLKGSYFKSDSIQDVAMRKLQIYDMSLLGKNRKRKAHPPHLPKMSALRPRVGRNRYRLPSSQVLRRQLKHKQRAKFRVSYYKMEAYPKQNKRARYSSCDTSNKYAEGRMVKDPLFFVVSSKLMEADHKHGSSWEEAYSHDLGSGGASAKKLRKCS